MAETLKEFLCELATDPKRLGAFISDPDAAMSEAGLEDDDRHVLKSGNMALIHQRLVSQEPPPTIVVIVGTEGLRAQYGQAAEQASFVPPSVATVVTINSCVAAPPYPFGAALPPVAYTPVPYAPALWPYPAALTPMLLAPLMAPALPPTIVLSGGFAYSAISPPQFPAPSIQAPKGAAEPPEPEKKTE
ncbi:MAG TPA: hypothetical protein VE961_17245 [Pyrinomonadaceae bacterium]|nr:hypothetical protein [Pyrinomonadaceae bacterium]